MPDDSTRSASTTKSCPVYRRSPPPQPCWAASSRCPASPRLSPLTRVATLSTGRCRRGGPADTVGVRVDAGAAPWPPRRSTRSMPQLLVGGYRPETPCAVVAFASWPQETVLRCTLSDPRRGNEYAGVTRTAVIVVGMCLPLRAFPTATFTPQIGCDRGGIDAGPCLLGGTSEARALAARLHPEVDVISSLAGRVPDPALPVGEVRIGGFGGVDGMRRWLAHAAVDAVVDATHPYAATITANAAAACGRTGSAASGAEPRPAWDPGDAIVVGSDAEAAKTVAAKPYSRVFLTTGRSAHGGLRRQSTRGF